MVVIASVRAGALRIRVQVYADIQRAETARLFIAFADRLELGFKVEVLDIGEIAASKTAHARDTTRAVGKAFAHARTRWHDKIRVVVELRVDRAGVGHGKVTAVATSGAGRVSRGGSCWRRCNRLDVTFRELSRGRRWWI